MRTYDVTVYYLDKAELLKVIDSPPERSFAAAWILSDLRRFGVDIPIVSPQPEESKGNFPLSRGQFQARLQAVPDIVVLFKEEAR